MGKFKEQDMVNKNKINSKKEDISPEEKIMNRQAWWVLGIGIGLMIVFPILFSKPWGWLDLSKTGEIGSSIGGMTAPAIGIMSSLLVYLSFRAQIRMNQRQWKEIKKQSEEKEYSKTLETIHKLSDSQFDNLSPINTILFKISQNNIQKDIEQYARSGSAQLNYSYDTRAILLDLWEIYSYSIPTEKISSIMTNIEFDENDRLLIYYRDVAKWKDAKYTFNNTIQLLEEISTSNAPRIKDQTIQVDSIHLLVHFKKLETFVTELSKVNIQKLS